MPKEDAIKIRDKGYIATGWDSNGNVVQCRRYDGIFGTITEDNGKVWWAISFKAVTINCGSINLTGQWTYAGTRGKISIPQSSKQVTMKLTIKPRTAPSPHYYINVTLNGDILEGTWMFKVNPLKGDDLKFKEPKCKGGKFYSKVNSDHTKITILSGTEDPCNHGWVGIEFFRK